MHREYACSPSKPEVEMILLADDELDDCYFNPPTTMFNEFQEWQGVNRHIAKTQLKKVVDFLKSKTVKAWGGNRVILSEDWEAIVKEVE